MSSARSSTETPALTRRTFAWDRTSLLKGMSWDRLRTILGWGFVMCDVSMTGRPGDSLSAFNPSQTSPTPLSLWMGHACSMSPDGAQADALESGGGSPGSRAIIDVRRRDSREVSGNGNGAYPGPRQPIAKRERNEEHRSRVREGFHQGHPAWAVVALPVGAGRAAGALAKPRRHSRPAGAGL